MREGQTGPDLGAFLAVSATNAAVKDGLPGLCAKLVVLLPGICPLDGTPVMGPYENLAKLLFPDWKERKRLPADTIEAGAVLTMAQDFRVVELRPSGSVRVFPLLNTRYYDIPTHPDQKGEACISFNPSLGELATPVKGKADFMLLNLSGIMRLDARKPKQIAAALSAAALWYGCTQRISTGRRIFMMDRVNFVSVDIILVSSNAVSNRVLDVIAGRDTGAAGQRKRADERARLIDETLPALFDKGLVGKVDHKRGVNKGGGAWEVKIYPPRDYLEATARTGNTGTRPWGKRRPKASK
jgi:hypothetical protein